VPAATKYQIKTLDADMKLKTYATLLVIFCLLIAVSLFILYKNKSTRDRLKMGEKLLYNLQANDVVTLKIKSGKEKVTLKRGENFWVVENRFNYPADFSKITNLVINLKEMKTGRSFKASPDVISRLSLYDQGENQNQKIKPENQKGIRVVLENKKKQILADLIIGKTSSQTKGNFIRPSKESTIYLVDRNFRFLETKPSVWIDKKLIDIDPDEIKTVIQFNHKKPVYKLQRKDKDKKGIFINPPKDKKINQSKIDQVFGALYSFSINDIVDPSKDLSQKCFEKTVFFEYHLFDGSIYKIYPGCEVENNRQNYYLRVQTSYMEPKKEETGDNIDKIKDKKTEAEKKADLSAKMDLLNKKISSWTYIISGWKYNNFITDPEEFFEKKKAGDKN